jgi:hypothetical protein
MFLCIVLLLYPMFCIIFIYCIFFLITALVFQQYVKNLAERSIAYLNVDLALEGKILQL